MNTTTAFHREAQSAIDAYLAKHPAAPTTMSNLDYTPESAWTTMDIIDYARAHGNEARRETRADGTQGDRISVRTEWTRKTPAGIELGHTWETIEPTIGALRALLGY